MAVGNQWFHLFHLIRSKWVISKKKMFGLRHSRNLIECGRNMLFISAQNVKSQSIPVHQICPVSSRSHATIDFAIKPWHQWPFTECKEILIETREQQKEKFGAQMILFFATAPRVIKMKHFQTTVCRLSCQIDGLEHPEINKLFSAKIRLIHVTDTRLCSSQLLLMFHFGPSYFTEDGHQPAKSWRQISDRSINGKKANLWQILIQGLFMCNIFILLPFLTYWLIESEISVFNLPL